MRKKQKFCTIFFSVFLLLSFARDTIPDSFSRLMTRAKMQFNQPDSLIEIQPKKNSQMNYGFALTYPRGHFEVRYAIRPLDSLLATYYRDSSTNKGGQVAMNPNMLYGAFFQAVLLNIFGGHLPPIKAFNPEAVKNEFNADWGAIAGGQVAGAFGEGYRYCSVVTIHKSGAGDAYYFYLADSTIDNQEFGKLMLPLFHSLTFR